MIFFYLFLTLLFLTDIFIFENLFKLSFYLALIFPIFLFLIAKIKNKKIFLPKISLFYILFFVFSGLSMIFAIDKETAFEFLLIYISAFLIFIFSFNYQDELKKSFSKFIIFLCVFASILFLINNIFHLNWFSNGASLFYTGYYHNEIASLLTLGIIINLVDYPLLLILFLPVFLFSYSRSAYLSLIITGLALFFKDKRNFLLKISLFLLIIFFLFTTSKNIIFTKNKKIFGSRDIYFSYALSSIKEKPWFGAGPGNFYFAALKRQIYYNENTTTAHNIILDILAENGVIAGGCFLLFLFFAFKKVKKDIYFYLVLSLSIVFLFDFAYRFNSILFLWFILLSLITTDKKALSYNYFTVILFSIIIELVILGKLLVKMNPKVALVVYPFQKDAYINLIEGNITKGNSKEAIKYLNVIDKLYGGSFFITLKEAYYYRLLNNIDKSIYFYEKSLKLRPFLVVDDTSILKQLLELNVKTYGRYIGRKKTIYFLNNLFIKDTRKNNPVNDRMIDFCQRNNLELL